LTQNPNPDAPITLVADQAKCELWPNIGGSIGRWCVGGQEIFRRADATAITQKQPLGMAGFPLIPYSNRIGFGRFDWNGQSINLAENFPPELHAIHGTGWSAEWAVLLVRPDYAVLRHKHLANKHWPWSFEAEQHITLSHDSLSLRLIARNLSADTVPIAFGFHPYFDSDGATLSFDAAQVWQTGNDGLPALEENPVGDLDFNNGRPVQGRTLDNGFAGWNGLAHICWQDRPLSLEINADMHAAVVYVPNKEDYFCFEPVPHIINALNLPGHFPQMPIAGPGGSFEADIRFRTLPADSRRTMVNQAAD
jgi:aldose 1-epimerase